MQVLHDYVQSIGNHFLYSQLAIDLVQKYMDKFPRVFELLSVKSDFLQISDFEQNNNDSQALEYLSEVRKWLQELPYFRKQRKPTDLMRLSDVAREHVQKAVNDSVSRNFSVYTDIPALNELFFSTVCIRCENLEIEDEMAKSIRSRFEQCICQSITRLCF